MHIPRFVEPTNSTIASGQQTAVARDMHDRISHRDHQRREKTSLLWTSELQPHSTWARICRSLVPYSFRWLCQKPRESQLNGERPGIPVSSTSSFWISFCFVCFLSLSDKVSSKNGQSFSLSRSLPLFFSPSSLVLSLSRWQFTSLARLFVRPSLYRCRREGLLLIMSDVVITDPREKGELHRWWLRSSTVVS